MRTIRRARGLAVALLTVAGTSCREPAAPSGTGRLAPTSAALAFSSVLPESSGEPVIPLRAARVRLFRLPGQVPERAVVDTVVPFSESDSARSVELDVVVTMVSERFGLELTLLDDQEQVVYLARDTVVAYTTDRAPPAKPVVLRYVGADTAVVRIALATDVNATEIEIGEPTPLRVSAFLRDGRETSARFGFAVRGTSAISVDGSGVLRASAPVAPGSAWIVARIATGLADSIALGAIVPAASISLTPASGLLDVGGRVTLDAVVRDAAGAALAGRRVAWSSSDEAVAAVTDGVVTAHTRGAAMITARSGRAVASALVTVASPKVARVVPSPSSLRVVAGRTVDISVQPEAADGVPLPDRIAAWSMQDGRIASVVPTAGAPANTIRVRGLVAGSTTLVADVEGVQASIPVLVTPAPAARVTIAPSALTLAPGDTFALTAVVEDGAGIVQPGRAVDWRSLDAGVATVDAAGVVRAIAGPATSIIASIDGVADTVSVDVRGPNTLVIARVRTTVSQRGEVVTFTTLLSDPFGNPLGKPLAQWSVTPQVTLSTTVGTHVEVVLPPNSRVVLTAVAAGLRADIVVSSSAVAPTVDPPPATPPSPPPVRPNGKPPAVPPGRPSDRPPGSPPQAPPGQPPGRPPVTPGRG